MQLVLRGTKREVVAGPARPAVMIGERINPTGRKRLAEELLAGDLTRVKREAVAQAEAGAEVIDVNVGVAGVDEVALLPRAVAAVAEAVEVPLCIDSANLEALEAALAVCPGKPLVNSVNASQESLAAILPLVARRGAAVIGLTMSGAGVPGEVEERLRLAKLIVEEAQAQGIPPEDVLIDCLAVAVATEPQAGRTTLEAMRRVRDEVGVNLVLGVSNISFGLPERSIINGAFLAMAIEAGLTCAIVDPTRPEIRKAILASDLLLGRDPYAMRYIQHYRALERQGGRSRSSSSSDT